MFSCMGISYASVAQLVEQRTENPRVVGSIPTGGTICGFSSFGRAPPCQGGGGGFEPRNPLQKIKPDAIASGFVFCRRLRAASQIKSNPSPLPTKSDFITK